MLLPVTSYASIKIAETGLDILRSLQVLILATFDPKRAGELRATRTTLQLSIATLVDELGPQIFSDFHKHRISESAAEKSREMATSPTMINDPWLEISHMSESLTNALPFSGLDLNWSQVDVNEVDDYFFFADRSKQHRS